LKRWLSDHPAVYPDPSPTAEKIKQGTD